MGASNYVHLDDCEILHVTERAILIRYDDEEFWLPISQVADSGSYERGQTGVTISVAEWLAKEKGL